MSDFPTAECKERVRRLTEREREVLRCLALGLLSKQIADELAISINTVRVYRERIYSKLGVNGPAQAAIVAHSAEVV